MAELSRRMYTVRVNDLLQSRIINLATNDSTPRNCSRRLNLPEGLPDLQKKESTHISLYGSKRMEANLFILSTSRSQSSTQYLTTFWSKQLEYDKLITKIRYHDLRIIPCFYCFSNLPVRRGEHTRRRGLQCPSDFLETKRMAFDPDVTSRMFWVSVHLALLFAA